MSEPTQEKPKGLFARIKAWWNRPPPLCHICNERPVTVDLLGECDECFDADVTQWTIEERERKNNQLKRAIKEALRELEEERSNKNTP